MRKPSGLEMGLRLILTDLLIVQQIFEFSLDA